MNISEIKAVVEKELNGASAQYLEEIVSHGIHNLTNSFNGETEEDYEAFSAEFKEQAQALLCE